MVFPNGIPSVVALITDAEWPERLRVYLRLATALGPQSMVIVPDQIANQDETLRRLALYRDQVTEIAATGAVMRLPLQGGALSPLGTR